VTKLNIDEIEARCDDVRNETVSPYCRHLIRADIPALIARVRELEKALQHLHAHCNIDEEPWWREARRLISRGRRG